MELLGILFGGSFTLLVCYSLGRLCLSRIPAPRVMALPVGGAILSLCVYTLLLTGLVSIGAFVALGVCALIPLIWEFKRQAPAPEIHKPVDAITRWLLAGVFTVYGVFYLVHTIAPEVQPDAVYYHLGLVNEYFRIGGFPDRIDFYEILPQGMETLFLFAFAFGRHSAAKVVHLGFLVATLPILVAIGRRLRIEDRLSWIAAAIYVCAPVVGVSSTSTYTDGALVCATLAAAYFLLVWRDEGKARYLIPAGLLCGFCYSIKVSAILWPALGALFVLIERRRDLRAAISNAAALTASALVVIAPWMIRAVALTGNPLAPLFNAWFPNPYFLEVTDKVLDHFMHTYDGFTYRHAAWELTMGGASQGIVGPFFLLAPLGLLALRSAAGRWLWIAGILLTIPWLSNVGTRFVMPGLPFFALAIILALDMALPHWIASIALLFAAISCWPGVLAHYERPGLWRLHGFPWKAALRIYPDKIYLDGALGDYRVAEMVNAQTKPQSVVLGLSSLADAYVDREVVQHWQSAYGVRLREMILESSYTATYPLFDWTASWPGQALRALRVRATAPNAYEWEIHEATFFQKGDRLRTDGAWQASAWPCLYEAAFALDAIQPTRWRSWEPARPGMYFEVDFDAPQTLDSLTLSMHWEIPGLEVYGKTPDGKWRKLGVRWTRETRRKENERRAAMRQVKKEGIDYIVTPVGGTLGAAQLGKDLADHAMDYGIREAGRSGETRLYRIDNLLLQIPVLSP